MNRLVFKAGPGALAHIQREGFDPALIRGVAGAAGGPKWLVLRAMDEVLLQEVLPAEGPPIHLIGASIGAWRFACWAQRDPLAALARFEAAYVAQSYPPKPPPDLVSARSRVLLQTLLGPGGAEALVNHPRFRPTILVNRSRWLTASDRLPLLAAGLITTALANVFSRRGVEVGFERMLVSDPRDRGAVPYHDSARLPGQRVDLTTRNVEDALMASASIPAVLAAVDHIEGAPQGAFRDGGIIDYHLDLPFTAPDEPGLVLFPHFFGRVVPGWFDKSLPWRKPSKTRLDRVLLIAPSEAFIETLPGQKVPDRKDFVQRTEAERITAWRAALDQCQALADELLEVLQTGALPDRVEPL